MQEASWPRHTSFTLIFDFIMQFDMVSSQQPPYFIGPSLRMVGRWPSLMGII
jgi:hypothetical protein